MLRIVPGEEGREDLALALDEICRAGAERMLALALQAEVADYLERHRACRDEECRAQVVRNGRARARAVVTPAPTGS